MMEEKEIKIERPPVQPNGGVQRLCKDIVKGDAQVLPVLPVKCCRVQANKGGAVLSNLAHHIV